MKKPVIITAVCIGVAAIITAVVLFCLPGTPAYEGFLYKVSPDDTEYIAVDKAQIEEYDSTLYFEGAVGGYYRDKLSGNERILYNMVAYAVDKGYSIIAFPREYYPGQERLIQLIKLYSCDSPFLEHNFTIDGKFPLNLKEADVKENKAVPINEFELARNDGEGYNQKKLAYDLAKNIVEESKKTYSGNELIEALYIRISKSTDYDKVALDSNTVPVYGVFAESHSICDGFADSLMMLYNLADIPCFTAEGFKGNTAHVVNIIQSGDEYYYLDSTADNPAYKAGFDGRFYYCLTKEQTEGFIKFDTYFNDFLPESDDPFEGSVDMIIPADYNEKTIEEAYGLITEDGTAIVEFDFTDEQKIKSFSALLFEYSEEKLSVATYNRRSGFRIAG